MKSELEIEEDNDFHPITESVKTHEVCAAIIKLNTNRKGFSCLIGALPQKMIRGNLYVMVVYGFDSNVILSQPIKNRQSVTIRDVFIKMQNILKPRGNDPKVYIMDNACSSDLKEARKKYNIYFQLAPPTMH